jgi:glutamine amidotransferase
MQPSNPACKVPHMGWNALETTRAHPLLEGEPEGAHMYFTHSFVLQPADEADVLARACHSERFPAMVARGNVAGVQFHPEKSQGAGLRLLANFLEWRP